MKHFPEAHRSGRARTSATALPWLLPLVLVLGMVQVPLATAPAFAQEESAQEESPAAQETEESQEESQEDPLAEGDPADDPTEHKPSRFRFDGFATLGLAHSSEEEADFAINSLRPDGAGFTRAWSGEVDSRLGLQLTADLTKKLSAVVQVVVEQQQDDSHEPELEWANLRYAFTDNFSLRIGRTALPIFAVSDHRKVGYANPWVRAPVEVYALVPIFNTDGIEASYRHRFAGWTNTVQASFSGTDVDLPEGATAKIRDLVGVYDTLERGFLTVRGGVAEGDISIAAIDPLFAAFRLFGGAEGDAIADRFELAGKRSRFAGLGATYDPGRWFVIAELGEIRTRSLLGDRTAGYLTAGYRVGELAPFVTYAEAVVDSPTSSPGLTLSTLPPPLVPVGEILNAVLNEELGTFPEQHTFSLGVRWDFHEVAALKLQIDRIDVDAGSVGSFVNQQPGFERGGMATIIGIAIDFVF